MHLVNFLQAMFDGDDYEDDADDYDDDDADDYDDDAYAEDEDDDDDDDDYENHRDSGLLTKISDSSTVNIIGSQTNNSTTTTSCSSLFSKGFKGHLTLHHLNPRKKMDAEEKKQYHFGLFCNFIDCFF